MKSALKNKYYIHLDTKKHAKEYEGKVRNPNWVIKHGFFPFIHFQMIFKKYVIVDDFGNKDIKHKVRNIYYSAHSDRFIYEYYGNKLNDLYNIKAKQLGINNAVVAYRNNKRKLSNIDFSKEVFEYIARNDNLYIFVADFTDFFDNLNHSYLKERICEVMGVDKLPDAEFKIFNSITNCSYFERDDIINHLGLKKEKIKKLDQYFNTEDFHIFKKKYLKKWGKEIGIPQGSSISAVYANVYMLKFDKIINDFVTSKKGIYRRYCDDIIIAIPILSATDRNECQNIKDFIFDIRNSIPNLIINENKTQQFTVNNKTVFDMNNKQTFLSYLGFTFDGNSVRLREKSLFKYYCRAYKKVNSVNSQIGQNKIAAKKALYKNYTHLGDKPYSIGKKDKKTGKVYFGNFITYARKADEKFHESTLIESKIHNQTKRHWKYINEKLRSD